MSKMIKRFAMAAALVGVMGAGLGVSAMSAEASSPYVQVSNLQGASNGLTITGQGFVPGERVHLTFDVFDPKHGWAAVEWTDVQAFSYPASVAGMWQFHRGYVTRRNRPGVRNSEFDTTCNASMRVIVQGQYGENLQGNAYWTNYCNSID